MPEQLNDKIKLTDAVVIPVMTKHNISREEAEMRLQLLYKSNILETGSADDIETQRLIDGFLAQDSELLAETVLFEKTFSECLENEEFVNNYDRLKPKAHLAYTKKIIAEREAKGLELNKTEERAAKKQLEMFGKFVREYVFSRFDQE